MYETNYAEDILDKEVISHLKKQGLTPIVEHDDVSEDIRQGAWSTWVGVDVSTRLDVVDRGRCFDDYVANYCKEILDCHVRDIVWATVYKYEHSGITYNLTGFACPWDSGISGFIYMTKEQIRRRYSKQRVTEKVRKQVMDSFEKEVEVYSKHINSDYLMVTLESESDEDEFCWYGGCSDEKDIINAINDMLFYTDYEEIPPNVDEATHQIVEETSNINSAIFNALNV